MQTSPGGLFRAACFLTGTGGDSAISQVYFGPAMVSSEVVNFRIPKALYDMGQAVVETGGAVSQSDLVALAVSGQIGEDLGAYQRQAAFAVSESRTGYAKGKGAESMQVSVRLKKEILRIVDFLVSCGAAESRSAYLRRAYSLHLGRMNQKKGMSEERMREIAREEADARMNRAREELLLFLSGGVGQGQ